MNLVTVAWPKTKSSYQNGNVDLVEHLCPSTTVRDHRYASATDRGADPGPDGARFHSKVLSDQVNATANSADRERSDGILARCNRSHRRGDPTGKDISRYDLERRCCRACAAELRIQGRRFGAQE